MLPASYQLPAAVLLLAGGIVSCFFGYRLFRTVLAIFGFILGATSFGGAWTMIVGAMALVGNRTALRAAASGDVWVAYPLNPAPGQRWVLLVWVLLSLIGAGVQLGITGGEKGRVVKRKKRA